MPLDTPVRVNNPFAHGRSRVAHSLLTECDVEALLDYGCGSANFAVAAATELGLSVHACDVDHDLIAQLDRQHGHEVNFFTISDRNGRWPLEDGQVSAVTCCDVLEHMPETSRVVVLREMWRVLMDNGVLIVTAPHKGLFSAIDPENAKVYFPRIHKYAYILAKGRRRYEDTYGHSGRGRFGNFSGDARKHAHFSAYELSELVMEAGFEVEEIRYFGLFYPLIRVLLWLAENFTGRVCGAGRFSAWCWTAYTWDADVEPGRLGFYIAIRARKPADRPKVH